MTSFLKILLTRDYKARIDATVHAQGVAKFLLHFSTNGLNNFMYFYCRSNGSYRIILMNLGDPEKGHDCVTDKFFNETIIFDNYLGNLGKNSTCDLFDVLGV